MFFKHNRILPKSDSECLCTEYFCIFTTVYLFFYCYNKTTLCKDLMCYYTTSILQIWTYYYYYLPRLFYPPGWVVDHWWCVRGSTRHTRAHTHIGGWDSQLNAPACITRSHTLGLLLYLFTASEQRLQCLTQTHYFFTPLGIWTQKVSGVSWVH